jgi:hypothetical protein
VGGVDTYSLVVSEALSESDSEAMYGMETGTTESGDLRKGCKQTLASVREGNDVLL